ncbi:ABC transporter ATP-binding protein [Tunicatimonas pelagia]|uniref:ABC transporter ATP-binding protein n=1 Tax=Tunicatimonas pelagia TaxID=931531 RepID=UPI0026655E70|nr:ABC transporter ATP-binding protein [Tunicatimonas pelagia]WKN45521.1 ABC transporter ATP-binding protein [Tunicatimonas pelagia]
MRTLLTTEDLSVQYLDAASAAIQHISLSVFERETVVIVGESGSGKTTLLKTMAGLLEPSEGKVVFDGKPLPPPSRRLVPGHPDIRMVFQDFGLSPNLTVHDNIDHVLRRYESTYRTERVQELISRCRLGGLKDQLPRTLSGGEKQRLALARALAEEPRLLLMDEPFGQVDTSLKQQLRIELADFLKESDSTVVMVTHDPKDALGLADTVVVVKEGKIVESGSPHEVYEQPSSAYSAQLFGSMTVLPVSFWRQYFTPALNLTSGYFGLRAEHVKIVLEWREDENLLDMLIAKVTQVVYQGFYQEVYLEAKGQTIIAFHQGEPVVARQTVGLMIDFTKLVPILP